MAESVYSKNGVPIRLTDERWAHIIEEHSELAGLQSEIVETVANPTEIFAGNQGELLAVREVEPGKYLVVVYRESQQDGFIITAFLTRKGYTLRRRQQLWPLQLLKSICVCCRLSNRRGRRLCVCRMMPRQTSCMSTSKNPVTRQIVNSRMTM